VAKDNAKKGLNICREKEGRIRKKETGRRKTNKERERRQRSMQGKE
jgi:hypothetical protein